MRVAVVVQLPPELGVENPLRFAMGGMAELFRGEKVFAEFGRTRVVVKHLLPQYNDEPELIHRFRDEARLGLMLRHPNIARVYEYREVDHHHFMVMEEIEGRSVKQLVLDCRRSGVRFSQDVAAHILGCVTEALAYVGQVRTPEGKPLGLIHRDISPSNVIVGRDGQAKLIDFGVARAADREAHTATGHLVGKYAYMSPEQIMDQELDPRADLFGLGVVGYEMLTGRNPFQGSSELDTFNLVLNVDPIPLSVARPDLHPMLIALVEQCLEKDREARFASPAALLEELRRYLTRVPDSPPVDRTVAFLERLTELRESVVAPEEDDTETLRPGRTDSLAPVARAVGDEPSAPSLDESELEALPEPDTQPGTPPPGAARAEPMMKQAPLGSTSIDSLGDDDEDTLKVKIRKRKHRERQKARAAAPAGDDLRLRPQRRSRARSGDKGEGRWGHPVELWRRFEARPPAQRIGIMIAVGLGIAVFLWVLGAAIFGGGNTRRPLAGGGEALPDDEGAATDPRAEIVVEDEPVLPYRGPRPGFEITDAEGGTEAPTAEGATPVAYGTISIYGVPAAEVWVDGEYVGKTPVYDVRLTTGEHELTFRNRELEWSRTDKVKISSGPNREIRLQPRRTY